MERFERHGIEVLICTPHLEASRAEYAPYDHGVYTFVACYLPWSFRDGMEHRNSTSVTSNQSLQQNFMGIVGTVSHEFFHSWNMERIRGAALEPFDLE